VLTCLCPAVIRLPQVCLALLALLLVTLHTPRASGAPVNQLRKLTQQRKLTQGPVAFLPSQCRRQSSDFPCDLPDGRFPVPSCCNESGCQGRTDCGDASDGFVCPADTTFVACCPSPSGNCVGDSRKPGTVDSFVG
jgi:hypothetical protein